MWSEETANDNLLVDNTKKYMEKRIGEGVSGAWKNFSGSFDREMVKEVCGERLEFLNKNIGFTSNQVMMNIQLFRRGFEIRWSGQVRNRSLNL